MKQQIVPSGFNLALEYMNKRECCFITAFRGEYSGNQNKQRNKELFNDIKSSGLSYIKSYGGYIEKQDGKDVPVTEDTFCVINTQYTDKDFISLCVYWCGKYDQEAVLITFPKPLGQYNPRCAAQRIQVVGNYYNANGDVTMEFNSVSLQNIEEYFAIISNKPFELMAASEYAIYSGHDVKGPGGRQLAEKEFREIYGDIIV